MSDRPQPSRLFRWLVLVFISLAMFGNYYVYDCISPLADVLAKQLGFSDSNIGLLQAIYSFPNIVMVLIGGIIIDRIGTKKSALLFGVICFFGAVVTAWPQAPAFSFLAGAVNGLLGLARSVDAQAFTTGRDIFFDAGRYQPNSSSGRELIAHEAVHVAQQTTGRAAASGGITDPADLITGPLADGRVGDWLLANSVARAAGSSNAAGYKPMRSVTTT